MRKVSILSVLAMLLLSACRTYGGYGSEEASLAAIAQANRLFAESLDRASRDGQSLDQAAASRTDLVPFAERYNALLDRHQYLVRKHAQLSADLTAGFGSYRKLKTVFDTVVAEQQEVAEHYAAFARAVQAQVSGGGMREVQQVGSRYYAAPPFYSRVEGRVTSRSLSDVLASL